MQWKGRTFCALTLNCLRSIRNNRTQTENVKKANLGHHDEEVGPHTILLFRGQVEWTTHTHLVGHAINLFVNQNQIETRETCDTLNVLRCHKLTTILKNRLIERSVWFFWSIKCVRRFVRFVRFNYEFSAQFHCLILCPIKNSDGIEGFDLSIGMSKLISIELKFICTE